VSIDINRVTLTGRLTRDPSTPSETICAMSVAVNGRAKDGDDGWKDTTEFVDVVAYGRIGAACANNLAKGRRVAVDGRLRLDRWQTKDGQKRSMLKVVAQSVVFLDPKDAAPGGSGRDQAARGGDDFDPEIPF